MAYNQYFNTPYPYQIPYYQQPMYQPYQPPVMAPQPTTQSAAQPPVQNGGFVQVRSFEEVRNWPMAPGNTVTFIDESRTHMYTKTASYNQLEAPIITSYMIVRENENKGSQNESGDQDGIEIPYAMKEDVVALAGVVRGVNETVMTMKDKMDEMSGTLYGIAGAKKKPTVKKDTEEE